MSGHNDFYPRRDAEQVSWLKNFRAKLDGHGKTLGLAPARIKEVAGRLDALIDSFEQKDRATATYQAAVAAHEELEVRLVAELRADIRELKANRLCSDAIKADLQIVSSSEGSFRLADARPSVVAEAHPGFVRLRFKKLGFDGVNVYTRRHGETAWRFLARDTNSPYDDHSDLEKPGVPEVREYRLVGVVKDQEQGQPTDAVSVTFTG